MPKGSIPIILRGDNKSFNLAAHVPMRARQGDRSIHAVDSFLLYIQTFYSRSALRAPNLSRYPNLEVE